MLRLRPNLGKVDREADDVVNVDVVNSGGVDRDVDTQLSSLDERDDIIEEFTFWD